eukprot:TRINITY_DN53239_c0_g1_i1.p1 TRINITY_DN53239_c0_g1~~TRINITY_DN53239_c0_g1_i1.p1  ORF type:complete len:813 (+),score=197.43 TRINITY_DN53239_c0_g1_i1:86-2524(+)
MEVDEGASSRTAAKSGGWRNAFLNRQNRDGTAGSAREDQDSSLAGERSRLNGERASRLSERSLSRTRANSRDGRERQANSEAFSFDQKAVLEQDRALIEQLTQRTQRTERSAVRKPPPPPKVTPYKNRSSATDERSPEQINSGSAANTAPPSPSAASAVGGLDRCDTATPSGTAATSTLEEKVTPLPNELLTTAPATEISAGALAETRKEQAVTAPASVDTAPKEAAAPLEPVVPRNGELFTAADIDSIMDRFGDSDTAKATQFAAPKQAVAADQCTQNFGDISKEFFQSHRMDVPQPQEVEEQYSPKKASASSGGDFVMPDRSALKQQIQAIDSWLEDDFSARERMSRTAPTHQAASSTTSYRERVAPQIPATSSFSGDGAAEAAIFKKLEDVKRKKELGTRVSPVTMKEIATQVKPLLPTMNLEQLVKALRLFTSARFEDHDLYLRILGEIPVQVRGISPAMLTDCLRVLWRLRLHEETYLELFSMEAMNMIRAARKPTTRAPRRPPAPSRLVDAAATAAAASGAVPQPAPPPAPSAPEVSRPFNATQLIHIANSLTQLGAKHSTRFMDVFQEQLTIAIPRFTQEECELVSPAFALSQLMHDPLRRAFLERCAEVDAGAVIPDGVAQTVGAAPDISQYQKDAEVRRRRVKNFRNIYIIEASVRKETFSFFSSLSAEVRTYLDRVHADMAKLKHEGASAFSAQVAAVLDQLGVSCDIERMAGPLSLHVVAKATIPRADVPEVVYECSDSSSFCAARQDDSGSAPQLTTVAKLRHKLLQRLGIQLCHINIWEWQQMSEAQRVNYMVKLQSLQ